MRQREDCCDKQHSWINGIFVTFWFQGRALVVWIFSLASRSRGTRKLGPPIASAADHAQVRPKEGRGRVWYLGSGAKWCEARGGARRPWRTKSSRKPVCYNFWRKIMKMHKNHIFHNFLIKSRRIPVNSGEFRWTPVNSGGNHKKPSKPARQFRWIPVNSGELRWTPVGLFYPVEKIVENLSRTTKTPMNSGELQWNWLGTA